MISYGKMVKDEFKPDVDETLRLEAILNQSYQPNVYDSGIIRVPIEELVRRDEMLRKSI